MHEQNELLYEYLCKIFAHKFIYIYIKNLTDKAATAGINTGFENELANWQHHHFLM